LDEGILNEGESAEIWTRVSQNLVSGNARVSVSTDNGETAMLPAPKRSWFDATPVPPVTCEFENYGRTFQDTDTGLTYVCDSTRDKWLSLETIILTGEEGDSCAAGGDPGSSANCNVDWGHSLGPDAATDLGLYIPYDATVIAYGFSEDNDACLTGAGIDIEIWNTGSSANDNAYALEQTIASGLTGQAHNANNLDVDILGNDYKLWGIDNNCGEAMDDFNIILYLKWRHN
jgi:hypothetical protein